ncbi:hypothetical protein U9M48_013688 [Paspalum notatum var. saurae]|uniref:Uncharacterized protein n=1 Tax=Paspalum notatum var. saurae TaxID=547442 RepID=A0AAQ3WJY4_PASNO
MKSTTNMERPFTDKVNMLTPAMQTQHTTTVAIHRHKVVFVVGLVWLVEGMAKICCMAKSCTCDTKPGRHFTM